MNKNFLNPKLSKKVQDTSRRGRKVPALVIETFFNKVTVRLANTGAILRNLDIVGGPVIAGQVVSVDYSSDTPIVSAEGIEGLNADDVTKMLAEVLEGNVQAELQMSITIFSGGSIREIYSPDSTGLATAISEAVEGDVIYLPDVDITYSFTMPEGVALVGVSSRQSIIRGKIKLASGSSLENLCVLRGEWLDTRVVAVEAQGDGRADIKNCEIHGYNCSNGPAYAIELMANTELLRVTKSTLIAEGQSGISYAILGATGAVCKVTDCFVYGDTGQYSGNGISVYGNTFGGIEDSEIDKACVTNISEDNISRSMHSHNNSQGHINDMFKPWTGEIETADNTTIYTDSTASRTNPSGPLLRYGNYIYYNDLTNDNYYRIVEYDMVGETYVTINVYYDSDPGAYGHSPVRIAIIGERQLVTCFTYDEGVQDYKLKVWELDFATETCDQVLDVDYDGWEELYDSTGITPGGPWSVTAHKTLNDEVVVIIMGMYTHWCTRAKQEGWYIITKNVTQGSAWTVNNGLYDNTVTIDADCQFHSCYEGALVVRNEKVVFPIGTDEIYGGGDRGTKILYFLTVDLFDLSVVTKRHIYNWTTTYDTAHPEHSAVSNTDGVIFVWVCYWPDTWSGSGVIMFDPYTQTVTEDYWELTDDLNFYLYTSKTKSYLFDYDNSNMYLLESSGHTLQWNKALSSAYKINVIDDDNRLWWLNTSTNVMSGILMTDKDDIITFQAPSAAGSWDSYWLLGYGIWLFWYRNYTNPDVLVLTVEAPGSGS